MRQCVGKENGIECVRELGHGGRCNFDPSSALPSERTGPGTPERAAETTALHAKERAVAELEAATIALRDAALAGKAAQARYQAALQAFNRAVAPDPDAK